MLTNVYLTPGVRTPIGTLGGALAGLAAPALGSIVIREAIKRAGVEPSAVNEVLMGNVLHRRHRAESRPPGRRSAPVCRRVSVRPRSGRCAAPV